MKEGELLKKETVVQNETHRKFISLMCKFRNNYPMDKIIGMKKSEFVMLMTVESKIDENGTTTVSQISNEMRMTNSAASKTIGVLEDNGFVQKKVNKNDKRQVYIEITEKGKKKLEMIKAEMDGFTNAVFDRFGKENADKLLELIEKMYEITSEEIKIRTNEMEEEKN